MEELNELELFYILNKYEILPKNLKPCSIAQFEVTLNALNEITPFIKLVAHSNTTNKSETINYKDSLMVGKLSKFLIDFKIFSLY